MTMQNTAVLAIAGNYVNGGTIVENYGVYVDDQTAGTNDYGVYVAGADTYALWVDSGTSRFDGTLVVATGTEAAPGISFNNDPDTGMWSEWGDQIDFSVAGSLVLTIDEGQVIPTDTTLINFGASDSPWNNIYATGTLYINNISASFCS